MTPDQIKQARRELGFTQQDLAGKLGIKLAKLRNWEQGRNAISDEGSTAIKWLLAGKIF
jgi:DNA-binding transcriptional regulator YiaG